MRKTRKGGYKRSGDFCEITIPGSEGYQSVIQKVSQTLSFYSDDDNATPVLMRMVGSKIASGPIEKEPWTFKRYLQTAFKTSSVKLGLGYIPHDGTDVSKLYFDNINKQDFREDIPRAA